MGKWITIILVALLIVAIITAPSQDRFQKFAAEKTKDAPCKPYVDYRQYRIVVTVFGIGHMRECKTPAALFNPATGTTVTGVQLPVYGETETYLGLFGTFWKL